MKNLIYSSIIYLLVLTSCAPGELISSVHYTVNVDSYGYDSDLQKKYCYLQVSDTKINESDLQYKEFYRYIKIILSLKGYTVVDSLKYANVVIMFNYGISDPYTENYLAIVPIYGQTSTSTTKGVIDPYSSNAVNYSQISTTTTNPTIGIQNRNRTVFLRYANFVAYDYEYYKKTKKDKIVWQTAISSSGNSSDLRTVFPYLLIASKNYLGRSSGEKKVINIYEKDPDVIKLKGY